MRTITQIIGGSLLVITFAIASGCATTQPALPAPLTYIAVERPSGPIKTEGQSFETKHSRSGLFLFNWGFRPAPDVAAYLIHAQADGESHVLKNTDVEFNVPVVIFLGSFGIQIGSDIVRTNQ